jgi:hypothetical protein
VAHRVVGCTTCPANPKLAVALQIKVEIRGVHDIPVDDSSGLTVCLVVEESSGPRPDFSLFSMYTCVELNIGMAWVEISHHRAVVHLQV